MNPSTAEGMPSRRAGQRPAAWIGVDLGGTNVRAGCLDESGQLHGWVSYPHRMPAGEFHCIEDAVARSLVTQECLGQG